jgi:alkanesulfonate monooxygenase SsuD/methylene tetrahydromethanopterin reductase-like flavin-dependent oxidoreductase (luciferase family)
VTSRVQLLSAVTLVPLYSGVVLTKLAACVDDLSDGRLNLGVGIGGENPTEFDACGVRVKDRGSRTDEALDLLRRLCTGKRFSYDGRVTRFTDGQLLPLRAPADLGVRAQGRRDAQSRARRRRVDAVPVLPRALGSQRTARRRVDRTGPSTSSSSRTGLAQARVPARRSTYSSRIRVRNNAASSAFARAQDHRSS